MKDNWIIKPVNTENAVKFSRRFSISYDTAAVLTARGFFDERSLFEFINSQIPRFHNPFLMHDMDRAVVRLRKAVDSGETIGLFSDSDIDGLASLTILTRLFSKLKCCAVSAYPENNDAYGITKKAVDRFCEQGVSLLITLDCGVRDCDEIAYAVSKGLDVIVCDHHEAGEVFPDAIIVDPKKPGCPYPFKGLAGASVAFKFAQAYLYGYLPAFGKNKLFVMKNGSGFVYANFLNGVVLEKKETGSIDAIQAHSDDPIFMYHDLPKDDLAILENRFGRGHDPLVAADGASFFKKHGGVKKFIDSFYDEKKSDRIISLLADYTLFFSEKINSFFDENIPFAVMGTIADVMPLTGENRSIVRYGLAAFEKSTIPSVVKLREICRNGVDAKAVAWEISPLLNAPGRYGKTSITAQFLAAEGERVSDLYESIRELNTQRRSAVAEIMKTVIADFQVSDDDRILLVDGYDISEGLTGLIAGRLSDHYNRPVIVFSKADDGVMKGSGRTSVDIDFLSYIEPHSGLLLKFGGHAGAFGFSIAPDMVGRFKLAVRDSFESTGAAKKKIMIDAEIALGAINYQLMNSLSLLEPFGAQNDEPLLLLRSVPVNIFRRFGNNDNHGKFIVPGSDLEIIGWNMADEMNDFSKKGIADIVFRLERNSYNGRETLRLVIVDIG